MPSNSTLNVYIVSSGFQVVASALIAENSPHKNIFICLEEYLCHSVLEYNPNWETHYLKFDLKAKKGLFSRKRSIKYYLNQLFEIIGRHSPNHINFHMMATVGSRFNYIIHEAKKYYSTKFNIIPDGAANLKIEPFSSDKKRRKIIKREKKLTDRIFGLKYTAHPEDKQGILSKIVDNIYTIPNIKNAYPKAITTPLPSPKFIDIPNIIKETSEDSKKSPHTRPQACFRQSNNT